MIFPIPRLFPTRFKIFVGDIVCHPLVGRALAALYGNRFSIYGVKIDTNNENIGPDKKAGIFWHIYESAEVRFVRKYLRPEFDVIEFGSSLGVISCLARKIVQPDRKLICLEANPSLARQTELNLKINGFTNYHVLNRAIDYQPSPESVVHFTFGASNTAGKVSTTIEPGAGVLVSKTTLAALRTEFQVEEFALICDIEGSEAGLLKYDGAALNNCRQLLIELHETQFEGSNFTVEKLTSQILALGFSLTARYSKVFVFEK